LLGWVDYSRAKTATERKIPLWNETLEAIKNAIASRPESNGYLFVSKKGQDYTDEATWTGWRVTGEFRQILKKVGNQDGRGFYALRRSFQTQAEECGDFIAVSSIMGHTPRQDDMSARYRQRISEGRLKEAVETVRKWLFPVDGNESKVDGGAA